MKEATRMTNELKLTNKKPYKERQDTEDINREPFWKAFRNLSQGL